MAVVPVWDQDAWRTLECECEEITDSILNRKLNHLLGGVASILEALASVLQGQVDMESDLQPVLDAINALATEEGEVASAVKTIVDKVNNGQVVVKADAQVLVDAINGVTTQLQSVVGSIPSDAAPIEPPVTPGDPGPDVPLPTVQQSVDPAAGQSPPPDLTGATQAPLSVPPSVPVESVPLPTSAGTESAATSTDTSTSNTSTDSSVLPVEQQPTVSTDQPAGTDKASDGVHLAP